jgi:hypothetical protein
VISLLHHSFFSACCQRGNVLSIYLSSVRNLNLYGFGTMACNNF